MIKWAGDGQEVTSFSCHTGRTNEARWERDKLQRWKRKDRLEEEEGGGGRS